MRSAAVRVVGVGLALFVSSLLAASAAAQETGPAYTDWNATEPGFPSNAELNPRANCDSGSDRCIDRTIGEMYRRFNDVVPFCDDNNIFSITYLRVTEDIRTGVDEGFYDDPAWLNRLDALFARSYFLAYDNHLAGRRDLVPPAWRVAFEASRDGRVEGIGNLLLSINAHVNRDFPFVLYRAGLVDATGASRKPAHDSGNDRLRPLQAPTLAELSRRFDETIDDYDVPGIALDDEAFFDLLVSWRESAWRNAERLAAAKDDAERRQIGQSIEEYALSQARSIYAGSVYGPGESTAARDARCAAMGGQDKGYRRGADVARFASKKAILPEGRTFSFPIRCPNGPGPCVGRAGVRGSKQRTTYEVPPGRTSRVSLLLPGKAFAGDRVRVSLRSLLGPGVESKRRRMLRVRAG